MWLGAYLLLLPFWLEWLPMLWLKPWFRPPEEALGFWPEPAVAAAVLEDEVLGIFLFSFRSSITSCYGAERSAKTRRGRRDRLRGRAAR